VHTSSFYWHDYETFGVDPVRDRPAQFAGIRTDLELNEMGEPLMLYCRPSEEYLPDPVACGVTGITPAEAHKKGVSEYDFICRILQEFTVPGSCVTGYNSIRFDDEVTRHTLYRNLLPPYEREYQFGNSRWDIIDMIRLAWATRPDGIVWPLDEAGRATFRLEKLTQANGIGHESAHDALSDVRATIALARLIKQTHPRLFDFVFKLRHKREVEKLLEEAGERWLLHVSSMYSVESGCLAPVMVLGQVSGRKNETVVYDLRIDPEQFEGIPVDTLRDRMYTPHSDRVEGEARPPVSVIKHNRCPVVAPQGVLNKERGEEFGVFQDQVEQNRMRLKRHPELGQRLCEIFQNDDAFLPRYSDPDLLLYGGGFFSRQDRASLDAFLRATPEERAQLEKQFEDARLPEMLFRFRARNFPDTLSVSEKSRWKQFCRERLLEGGEGFVSYAEWVENLTRFEKGLQEGDPKKAMCAELRKYADTLLCRVGEA
jgi:exodeoxyribonuclease-1